MGTFDQHALQPRERGVPREFVPEAGETREFDVPNGASFFVLELGAQTRLYLNLRNPTEYPGANPQVIETGFHLEYNGQSFPCLGAERAWITFPNPLDVSGKVRLRFYTDIRDAIALNHHERLAGLWDMELLTGGLGDQVVVATDTFRLLSTQTIREHRGPRRNAYFLARVVCHDGVVGTPTTARLFLRQRMGPLSGMPLPPTAYIAKSAGPSSVATMAEFVATGATDWLLFAGLAPHYEWDVWLRHEDGADRTFSWEINWSQAPFAGGA